MMDNHKEDHDRIISMVDCSQEVAGMKVELALLKEWKKEQKDDATKKDRQQMWFGGIIFSVIMAVGASSIQQNATVQVQAEKITEQKSEIKDLRVYISDVVDQMNAVVSNHEHDSSN